MIVHFIVSLSQGHTDGAWLGGNGIVYSETSKEDRLAYEGSTFRSGHRSV